MCTPKPIILAGRIRALVLQIASSFISSVSRPTPDRDNRWAEMEKKRRSCGFALRTGTSGLAAFEASSTSVLMGQAHQASSQKREGKHSYKSGR